jgi:glycine/D-amino acid oxidase-like deaminating enzyme
MADRPHVLVVGAGIIGASIAWHLARAGAHVTVIDAVEPGGLATRHSWAWINASWGNPEPYFRLRVRAMEEWRRLEREVPSLRVSWSGGLLWDLQPDELESFAAGHTAWGYEIRRVARTEVRQLEPYLADPPEFALHMPAEGAVEPLAASRLLLGAAQSLGGTVIPDNPVRSLSARGGRVTGVETSAGPLYADEVVVAAAFGTASLAATIGLALPVSASPALLVHSQPFARRLNGLVVAPGIELRQTQDGRFVAALSFENANANAVQAAAAGFDAMRGMLTESAALLPGAHVVGWRPMPKDGFPIVGRAAAISGLYVAAMHSGITLAPVIGKFAADEILTGSRDSLIRPYGPERFATNEIKSGVFQ